MVRFLVVFSKMDNKRYMYWILLIAILLHIATSFINYPAVHRHDFYIRRFRLMARRMPSCGDKKTTCIDDDYFHDNSDIDIPSDRLKALPRLSNDDLRVNRSSLMPTGSHGTMQVP